MCIRDRSRGSHPAMTSLFWRMRSFSNAERVEWTPNPSDCAAPPQRIGGSAVERTRRGSARSGVLDGGGGAGYIGDRGAGYPIYGPVDEDQAFAVDVTGPR